MVTPMVRISRHQVANCPPIMYTSPCAPLKVCFPVFPFYKDAFDQLLLRMQEKPPSLQGSLFKDLTFGWIRDNSSLISLVPPPTQIYCAILGSGVCLGERDLHQDLPLPSLSVVFAVYNLLPPLYFLFSSLPIATSSTAPSTPSYREDIPAPLPPLHAVI
jgi:hypothetical protein